MTEFKLEAVARNGGKPNYVRREGRIPAVVYGHRRESQPISVDALGFGQVLEHGVNVLIKLTSSSNEDTVMVKDIQRDPVRGNIIHVDFLAVALDEVLTARVPLHIVGDEVVSAGGGIVQHQLRELEVECLPTDVPGHITVDVSALHVGDHINAGSLQLPAVVKLLTPVDEVVVTVVAPRLAEVEAAAPAAEEPVEGAVAPEEPPK